MTLTNAQINLETAFKKFSDEPKTGSPKFKCKHKCRVSYTSNCINHNIRITESDKDHRMYIKLPKLGKVKMNLHRLPQGNYTKQKAKYSKSHLHIANQRKDFLHKESRKIANSYDYVVVENIDMKALS